MRTLLYKIKVNTKIYSEIYSYEIWMYNINYTLSLPVIMHKISSKTLYI